MSYVLQSKEPHETINVIIAVKYGTSIIVGFVSTGALIVETRRHQFARTASGLNVLSLSARHVIKMGVLQIHIPRRTAIQTMLICLIVEFQVVRSPGRHLFL